MQKLLLMALIVFAGFFAFSHDAHAAITRAPNNLGLVGYWSFDEGTSTIAHDFSGNGRHGTLTSIANPATVSSGWTINGRQGKAIVFDGSNDFVDIPSNLGVTTFPFTQSVWIKTSSASTQVAASLANTTSNTLGHFIGVNASGVMQLGSGNVASRQTYGTRLINDGRWHHIVGVYASATNYLLYIDGTLEVSTTTTSSGQSFDNFSIGKWNRNGSSNPFLGLLDEARVYNRALSATEVAALYNTGAAKFNSTRTDVLTDGLVGHWTMDGKDTNWTANKLVDLSGRGFTGIFTNMSTTTSPVQGISGQSMLFDGVDDYITTSSNSSLDLSQTYFTASAWVKLPNLSTSRYFFSKKGNNNRGWRLGVLSTGAVELQGYGVANTTTRTGTGVIADTKWHHITIVRDDTSYLIYVDGASQSLVTTPSATPQSGSSSLMIGAEAPTTGSPTTFYNYQVDDARIYNRALSAAEVAQLYRMGSDTKQNVTASTTPALANGLVGHWTFDGKHTNWGTNKTNDQSGQGNHGTMTSMSTTTSPAQGRLGQALKFDNSDDYVNAGSASVLDDMGPMTVSVWIKPKSYGGASQAQIINKAGTGGLGWYFSQLITGNTIRFVVNHSTTNLDVRGTNSHTTADFGKWTHWVMTWDGTTNASGVRIYKNGTEISYTTQQNASGSRVSDAASSLLIGNLSGANRTFDGDIDEVRLYDRTLSSAEITQLYNMGR